MKKTELKGYLKDLENKNKKFSYKKTVKILDVINFIYLDQMKRFQYEKISDYNKAKYLFYEITEQFSYTYKLLNEGKILMATCLLRNIYEEILYIMATSYDSTIEVTIKSYPVDFRDVVKNNCNDLLSDYFESDDVSEIYSYLSKLTHVTNLKEATSYLMKTKKYNGYIVNEIKFMTLLIEYMYLTFLFKKGSSVESDLCLNSVLFAGYIEIINFLYYVANSDQSQRYLKKYFYGEKNQKYLSEQNEEMKKILNEFKVNKNNVNITIKKVINEFNKQLKQYRYFDIANEILGK